MSYSDPSNTNISELHQALNTAQFELNYERSCRIVEGVNKDEEIRKLKFKVVIMADEVEELNEQLAKEEERGDLVLQDLEDANSRSDDLDADVQQLMNELRVKSRELETAQAEVAAMSDMSNDTTKVLKEKLTLARELANLKPELEHLRSQGASHQELLSEKLSLQRQLTTMQVELENAQRTAQRATTKAGKTCERHEEYETEIEQLKDQLQEFKQTNKDSKQEIEILKRELDATKKFATKVASKQDNEADEGTKAQIESFRKDLITERKERQRAEKALEKQQTAWEAQRMALDDKIASFRAKLKSTKEKLKETELDLQKAQEAATNTAQSGAPGKAATTKTAKKRLMPVDPDAAIGTPGDHVPAKRGKKTINVGDKSTFSITPFLNRTMTLPPESPGSEESKKRKAADDDEAEEDADVGAEVTPIAAKQAGKKATKATKPKALAPASSAKQNSKPPSKRTKAAVPTLDKVAEESEIIESAKKLAVQDVVPSKDSSENNLSTETYKEKTTTTTVPTTMVPKLKATSKKQPRKSLLSFAAFMEEPAPAEKKKKRKLLGNSASSSILGKTLFDEDDGDKLPSKPIPGRGLFAGRGLLGGKKKLGVKGPLVAADDGFMFSPLKKDKKAAALAQSMLGN